MLTTRCKGELKKKKKKKDFGTINRLKWRKKYLKILFFIINSFYRQQKREFLGISKNAMYV